MVGREALQRVDELAVAGVRSEGTGRSVDESADRVRSPLRQRDGDSVLKRQLG
jgi:hypothetical protein